MYEHTAPTEMEIIEHYRAEFAAGWEPSAYNRGDKHWGVSGVKTFVADMDGKPTILIFESPWAKDGEWTKALRIA